MNGESSINLYTLSGVRQTAAEGLLWSSQGPFWFPVVTWRNGNVEGRKVPEGEDGRLIMADSRCLWKKPTQHCKS